MYSRRDFNEKKFSPLRAPTALLLLLRAARKKEEDEGRKI